MELRKIHVPGKVMLSGEYAVLYGAKSALMPVPRFIEVMELNQPADDDYSPALRAALNQVIPEIAKFEKTHGLPHIKVNRDQLFTNRDNKIVKFGLGCSAAEAVGAIALRFERAGIAYAKHKDDILKHALEAHSRAQAGLGSGADVVACAFGVPIKYRVNQNGYQVETININAAYNKIPMNLFWSGISANTREIVTRFQNWTNGGDRESHALMKNLIRASDNLADAWFGTNQNELFDLLDRHAAAMRACAQASEIAYEIPIHKEIEAWAEKHSGRAKPTGAGGGDMILLVGDLPVAELDGSVIPLSAVGG